MPKPLGPPRCVRLARLDVALQEDTGGPVVVEESYWMMGESARLGARQEVRNVMPVIAPQIASST